MSNPYEQQTFARPGPQQDQPPIPQQPWQPQNPPQQLQYLPSQPQWQSSQPAPKQRNGLAITALVVACLAMLMVMGLIVSVVVGGFLSSGVGDLHGTAPRVVAGQTYPGALLAAEVKRVISADFAEVGSMTCPATPVVRLDAVAACHGEVDGFESQVTVTFQDDLGHFTLVED